MPLCGLGLLPAWLENELRGQNNRCILTKLLRVPWLSPITVKMGALVRKTKQNKTPGECLQLFLFNLSTRNCKVK